MATLVALIHPLWRIEHHAGWGDQTKHSKEWIINVDPRIILIREHAEACNQASIFALGYVVSFVDTRMKDIVDNTMSL